MPKVVDKNLPKTLTILITLGIYIYIGLSKYSTIPRLTGIWQQAKCMVLKGLLPSSAFERVSNCWLFVSKERDFFEGG